MRWPKYWSFSFSIIPSQEIPGKISFRMDWLDLLVVQGTLKSLLPRPRELRAFFSCMAWRAIPGPLSQRKRASPRGEAGTSPPTSLFIRRGLSCTFQTAAWQRSRTLVSPHPTGWTAEQPRCTASTRPRTTRTGGRCEPCLGVRQRLSQPPSNQPGLGHATFYQLKMDPL